MNKLLLTLSLLFFMICIYCIISLHLASIKLKSKEQDLQKQYEIVSRYNDYIRDVNSRQNSIKMYSYSR